MTIAVDWDVKQENKQTGAEVMSQLCLKSSRTLSQVGIWSTLPGSTRLSVIYIEIYDSGHRGPARFLVDLGHISVEKKYISGKNIFYFLPNIYFFSTDMCPKSTKKRAGPL